MKLLFATGNEKKYELMKRRLRSLTSIEVLMPKKLGIDVYVDENGKTAEENAIIKAVTYHKATGMPVIAEDSGLWIEKFSDEDQPRLHVKRVDGKENPSDEEVLEHYTSKLALVGGESLARYITGVAIVDETGNVHSTSINEKLFLMKATPNELGFTAGAVLDCISYDVELAKYFNEFTDVESNFRYVPVDEATRSMCNDVFTK